MQLIAPSTNPGWFSARCWSMWWIALAPQIPSWISSACNERCRCAFGQVDVEASPNWRDRLKKHENNGQGILCYKTFFFFIFPNLKLLANFFEIVLHFGVQSGMDGHEHSQPRATQLDTHTDMYIHLSIGHMNQSVSQNCWSVLGWFVTIRIAGNRINQGFLYLHHVSTSAGS